MEKALGSKDAMFSAALKTPGLKIVMGTDAVAGAHGQNMREVLERVKSGTEADGRDHVADVDLGGSRWAWTRKSARSRRAWRRISSRVSRQSAHRHPRAATRGVRDEGRHGVPRRTAPRAAPRYNERMARYQADVVISAAAAWVQRRLHLAQRGITDVVLIERETQLAPDRPARTPAACATSSRTRRTSRCRSNRSADGAIRRRGRHADRLSSGRLPVPALDSRRTSRPSRRTSRCSAASASTSSGSTPTTRRGSRPGSTSPASRGATFCQRDGIADPNGVTMGFAKGGAGAGRRRSCARPKSPASGSRASRHGGRRPRGATYRHPVLVNAAGPWAEVDRPHGSASTCRSSPSAATSSSRARRGGSWDDRRMPAACRGRRSW